LNTISIGSAIIFVQMITYCNIALHESKSVPWFQIVQY
jgi:hypothetical protein